MPIELHILGEPGTNYVDWQSFGVYVNDDGVTLNTAGNFNAYSFTARATTTKDITIRILPTKTADNYKDKMEKGCYGVNMNDYISALYLYNGADFQMTSANYKATAKFYDGAPDEDLGQAVYNDKTDRLELVLKSSMCISRIQQISIKSS